VKFGNLNRLETSGPAQACNGTVLPPWKVIITLEANGIERKEFVPVQVGLVKISFKRYAWR